jgi:hypothetical protein
MKFRSGFVSNSSSSSFVIAIDESKFDVCPHCKRRDPTVLELIALHQWEDTHIEWEDPQAHIENLQRELDAGCFYQDEEKQVKNVIENIKAALAAGKKVIGLEMSYHETILQAEMDNLVKEGKIEYV